MKKTYNLLIVSCLSVFVSACFTNVGDVIDKTAVAETPPTYSVDSPMWRRLASPANFSYNGGIFRTESENLYSCVMAKKDTFNNYLKLDNFSHISIWGNVDAQTVITGDYIPGNNYWTLSKAEGTPRYSPILLGPFVAIGRFNAIEYYTLLGSGYSVDESYPSGYRFFDDFWLKSDYNLTGNTVQRTFLTGFVANNAGYFIENDAKKQMWYINNGRIYEKRKPFSGGFFGKFVFATAKINKRDEGDRKSVV